MKHEFLFLRYEKIKSPFEILKNAVAIGWKLRKYQRWSDVHINGSSKEILKEVGDSLIDSNQLPNNHYGHISAIFTKVSSWAINKDDPDFNLLPAELRDYEILSRINNDI